MPELDSKASFCFGFLDREPMARKPKPRARIDLSSLPPEDAPTAAMAGFDNTISILFCARRPDQTTRFGSIVRRDDLPANLGFAVAVEEAGHDMRQQLSVLPDGDVADQDVNLVTGLMAAVAQQVWRAQEPYRRSDPLRLDHPVGDRNQGKYLKWAPH